MPHIGTLNSIKAPIGSEAVWLKWILAKMVQNEGIFRSFEANSQPMRVRAAASMAQRTAISRVRLHRGPGHNPDR